MPTSTTLHRFSSQKLAHVIQRSVLLLISLSLLTCATVAQDDKEMPALELGKPIERELAGGHSQSYRITLTSGQYIRVLVDQRGVDVLLTLFGPEGKKLTEVDSPNGAQGPEALSWITDQSGYYRLEVGALDKVAPSGRYKAEILELHQATAEDHIRQVNDKIVAGATVLTKERIVRTVSLGEVHNYKITLESSNLLHVLIDVRRGQIAVRLFDSDNNQVMGRIYLGEEPRSEPITLIAEVDGTYRLEVRLPEHESATADYLVGLADGASKARQQAVQKYVEEFSHLPASMNMPDKATLLNNIGNIYASLEDYPNAIQYYKQAVPLFQRSMDRRAESLTLFYLGRSYHRSDKYIEAIEHYKLSLQIRRTLNDRSGEASVLRRIGSCYFSLNENSHAISYFQQALDIKRALNDRLEQARILSFMGQSYLNSSLSREAADAFGQELTIRRMLSDRQGEASCLTNLGVAYVNLGEIQQAFDANNEALRLKRDLGDKLGEFSTLHNLATFYGAQLGEHQKALETYQQALQVLVTDGASPSDQSYGRGNVLNSIANEYLALGDYQKALSYYNQASPFGQAINDPRIQGNTFFGMGKVYAAMGDYRRAIEAFNRALPFHKAAEPVSGPRVALRELGSAYYSLRDYQESLRNLNEALRLARTVTDRRNETLTLYALALVNRDIGKLNDARTEIEVALKIVEATRAQLISQVQRVAYFANVRQYYDFYIDLLMRLHKEQPSMGHDGEALQASESGRARTLLETLAEANANIRQGVDPKLVERERALQQRLNVRAQEQMKLLAGTHTEEQSKTTAQEIEALTTEFQQVETQIRQSSPRYAALTQPQPRTLKEIQTQVLDTDTLLLEYSLGTGRSYLWAVTPDSIKSYELPKRDEIEAASRRLYDLFNARNKRVKGETKEQWQTRVTAADGEIPAASSALSQMVLAPVAAQLGKKRLVIVADGVLQYIPFAALPAPSAQGSGVRDQGSGKENPNRPQYAGSRPPLIVEHEIVSLPSASTLAVIRREVAGRKPAPKMIVALADPVFMKNDERLKGGVNTVNDSTNKATPRAENVKELELVEAVEDTGTSEGLYVPRLPGSRKEAEEIVAMAPKGESKLALDFDASRDVATSAELSQYRYVHFSTHGFLNSVHPELSGIVFSLVNERGEAQDGFLRAHEVFNLKLPAELVVLSACQTGIGKEVKGEGLVSLTRGFMYAGAPRVVVSLWSVSEMGTTELMVRFYREMLKKGLRPAAALRAAQISLMKEKRWTSPFYWAPFTLQGEWR